LPEPETALRDGVFQNDKGVFVIRWEGDQDIDRTNSKKKETLSRHARAPQPDPLQGWVERLKSQAKIECFAP